jgi:hypothetical protein
VVIVEDEEDEDQKALKLLREQIKQRFGGIIGMTAASEKPASILKQTKKFDEDENQEDDEEYDVEEVSDH